MEKNQVVLRLKEKFVKLQTYHHNAVKEYGEAIAKEMFANDLDFYTSLLMLLGKLDD